MTTHIDLNADLGEMPDDASVARDIAIMDIVSSVNIACGGHAGDEASMRKMLRAAKERGISAGAHPSYPDRKNFGRASMDISFADLAAELRAQLSDIKAIAEAEGAKLSHVKPHGALYNDAADNSQLAVIIAGATRAILPDAALVGLAGGAMQRAAMESHLPFVAEAFIDRRYTRHGRLLSRNKVGAVLESQEDRTMQALALAQHQPVISDDLKPVGIIADSLCLHSDSDGALECAKLTREALESAGIRIRATI